MSRQVAAAEGAAREPRVRARELPAWVPGLACLALVGVSVVALARAGDPYVPENEPGSIGWAWLFTGAALAAFLAYLAGLWLLERARSSRLAVVLAVAAAVQLLPLAGPVLLSTDVYSYWDYARLSAVHGANPYTDTPSLYPDDPAFPLMGSHWYETPTVYGPGLTLFSEGHAAVAGESAAGAAWFYKALGAGAVLVLAALAARLGRRPAFSAALVGWNPVLAFHFAGGGHNDALMMVFVLGALALAASGRRQLAGAAWALSIAVKWVPLVFVPLRLIADWRNGKRVPYQGFAAAVALVAGVAFWRYGGAWLGAFGPLADNLREVTRRSFPHRLVQITGMPAGVASGLFAAGFAVFYLWLLREAWRGRARLTLAACGLLLATTWLVPWYAVWAVPLAAVEEDRAARWLAVGLSAYLVPMFLPI
jgi:hypothetical protein